MELLGGQLTTWVVVSLFVALLGHGITTFIQRRRDFKDLV